MSSTATNLFLQVTQSLLMHGPVMIVYLVGLAIALARWRKHPRVSLYAAAGFGLFIIGTVAFAFVYAFVPRVMNTSGGGNRNIGTVFTIVGLVRGAIFAGGFAFIVAAIFSGRSSQPIQTPTQNS